jgi:hypothetical protein
VGPDAYERQRAVRQRIDEVRTFVRSVDEAAESAAAASGLRMADVDPDGSLRAALPAVAGVARSRPGFDLMLAGPGASVAIRIRNEGGEIEVELLHEGESPADAGRATGARPAALAEDASDPEPNVASDLAAMLRRREGF